MNRTQTLALVSGVAVSMAGAARGQCTWYIQDVPDFDQHRLITGSVAGLPANGKMYCVPTSLTNWFAYLANRGIPQANTLDGPRDWQDNANYDRVTSVLSLMGTLMETDPNDGTKGKAVSGARGYAAIFAGGDVVVSGKSVFSDGQAPSPSYLLALQQLGAYTAGTYGFYPTTSGGQRNGGHAITFTGVWDLGCGQAPILQFNDPAYDGYNTTQSQFRTSLAALVPVSGTFTSSSGNTTLHTTLYRMDVTTASTNFLDATYSILPLSGLFGGGGTDTGELQIVRPFRPTGNVGPGTVQFNKPAGTGQVVDVAMGDDPLVGYFTTTQGTSQTPGVWRFNLLTGQSTRISPFTSTAFAPTRLAIGRLGDLYIIDNGVVKRYDPSTTPMTLLNSFAPTPDAAAIAYDDKNDTVIILTEPPSLGARKVLTYPRTLSGFGSVRDLPSSYSGNVFIKPDADAAGAIFVCSDGSGVLRRYEPSGPDLVQTDSIIHVNATLSALNVTDANRLIYAVNGVLVEREKNTAGTWVNRAGSRWAGRAADGSFSLAQSRDNFVASIMSGPEFNNLENPTVYPSLPVCYANCDQSTTSPVLNVLDFACFLNKFAAGNAYANCDHSTTPPELNVLDFSCFLNRFASGCP